MMPSPLRLEAHFFTHIHLEACEKGAKELAVGVFKSQLNCKQHQEDPEKWMVTLGLWQQEDKEKGCPQYTFHLEVVGLFAVDKKYPPEKAEVLVRANGAAILYGAIREMVANLSARGPFAQVNLPTVTFVDETIAKKVSEPKEKRKAVAAAEIT